MPAVDSFLASLAEGRACLHPTDTLPGLTFDPASPKGRAAVLAVKLRDEARPFLGLVPDLAAARRFFAPLPGDWAARLAALWPGPLSVVWTASAAAPRSLVSADGEIGLRVPRLPTGAAWYADVLRRHGGPLPTTSVNGTGQPAITDWAEAARFLAARPDSYVPDVPPATGGTSASTIIRLKADGAFEVLREGAMRVPQP